MCLKYGHCDFQNVPWSYMIYGIIFFGCSLYQGIQKQMVGIEAYSWYTLCYHHRTMVPLRNRFKTPKKRQKYLYSFFSTGETRIIANELWEWYPRARVCVWVCVCSVIHISASSISGLLTCVPALLYLFALALRAVWWRRRALLSAFSDHHLLSHGLFTARTTYYDRTLSGLVLQHFRQSVLWKLYLRLSSETSRER